MAIGVIEQLKEYAKCSNGNGNCEKCFGDWNCGGSCHEHAKMLLQDLDVREVKRGHWIAKASTHTSKRGRLIHYHTFKCSVCGKWNGRHNTEFCPKCGADMRGDTDDL